MKSPVDYRSNWSGGETLPQLNSMSWNLLAIPAAVLVVMAVLQIISFSKFENWLSSIGVGWQAGVAVILIIAELWGALSLLRVPLHAAIRFVGVGLAVLVIGFWFVENLYLVSNSPVGQLANSGYFGKYLSQSPGWWTVIEATVALFWVVYAAELVKWRPNR